MKSERRSPTPAAVHKREAIRRLKDALAANRFVLHYQPVVSARDLHVVSVEALLRWRRPDEENDDITELLASVERSPVIFKLENWTIEHAFAAAEMWEEPRLNGIRVAVNLSAREFPRADLVRRLRHQLSLSGLTPASLAVEITETSSMSDFAAAAEQLQQLSAMGVELWLDDFGTGHSSLEWLSRLPTHGVKIPGTFVERLAEKACLAIVTRVVELAHDLDLRVIAEGVETAAQRDVLAGVGVDLFQGYLFYPALPAVALAGAVLGASASSS